LNNLQIGVDAQTFVDSLEGGWDTVIFDPPYFNLEDKAYQKRISGGKRVRLHDEHTRIMDKYDRERILISILEKAHPDVNVIYFHSKIDKMPDKNKWYLPYRCDHVWVKPIMNSLTGSQERHNAEYMRIFSRVKPKSHKHGGVLNTFINAYPPTKRGNVARACAKPSILFSQLYKHLGSKHILDPFAGYGMSLNAGIQLGLKVDGCDIDETLQWYFRKEQKTLEEYA
tara:strand:+ start:511 stop:1191 length:681 start_codon:yes stop_codon:yes gene_type:complete